MRKLFVIVIAIIFISPAIFCQSTKKVLFLGNSYTGVNNLPQIIASIANSMNDTLIYDMNVPGGFTLQAHSTNTTTLNKIKLGNWDLVVLQEQSQLPSFPDHQVELYTFPYAHFLDSVINDYNDCCETMFYMTWGRKNGDASNCSSWPPVCTYVGMDSILYVNYMKMTHNNNAVVSPVGAAWKYIRQNYPSIELYQADGSHPSQAGSYAAACCFYTAIFRKDPSTIAYNYSIPAEDAASIHNVVKEVVYDSLAKWQIGKYDPVSSFDFVVTTNRKVDFSNLSNNADSFLWDFGDNTSATENDPVHTYSADGYFNVKLTANSCNGHAVSLRQIVINSPGTNDIVFYPNPVTNYLYIGLQPAKIEYISIFNCLGQQLDPVYSDDGNRVRIDLSMFSRGIYFVSVVTSGKRITQKIIRD